MFNVPPVIPKQRTPQAASQWEPYGIEDFTGGLNTNDPAASLRNKQFAAMSNWYLQTNRGVKVRGPFRPWLVASEDTILPDSAPPLTFIIVELRGSDYRVASWDAGATWEVSVYDETNDRWAGEGAGTSIKTGLTDGFKVRFVKYSINEAEDLIFCNGKDTPQRWVGSVDTASSDLGLTVPPDGGVAESLTYVSHATADGGASTIITWDAAHGMAVGEHVLFTGVTGANAATWNSADGVEITAVGSTTTTFAIAYSVGNAFPGTATHTHWLITTAAEATGNGRGIEVGGTYYYKFTYHYDSSGTDTKFGESGPSASVEPMAVPLAVSGTPYQNTIHQDHALPSGVDAICIYRSKADTPAGPFRFVGRITGAADFVDTVPVGEEGVEITLDAGTPPKLKNPIAHDSRIWGIGINSSGQLTNKGVYSRRGAPDMFPALNFIYFPHALAGPVLFNKFIYWFTEKQIWITTDLDDPAGSTKKIADIGCDSFDSIVDVGNGLVWQFDGNIYWANFNSFNPVTGELPWPIGDPIRDKIKAIPTARRLNSSACLYKDRYYLSYTGTSQTVNTATVVWDVKHGSRLITSYDFGAWSSVDWAGNDLQTFDGTLFSLDNTNKYIMEHEFAGVADFHSKTGFDASTSFNINTQLSTGVLHFGHEWRQKLVNSLSIVAETTAITLDTTLSFDAGSFERTKQFTLGSGTFAVDSTWLIWGQGTWDNFKWGSETFAFHSDHKKYGKGGKGRNAQLTLESTDSQDTVLIALKLYFKLLPIPA